MDINELKKEFDEFKLPKEEKCELESCDSSEIGFIERIKKEMLAPARCGVYFSKLDIKVIGLMIGEDVQVKERRRMLRDILRSVTSKDEFKSFIDAVDEVANSKIKVYNELMEHFPSSKDIFQTKKEKYGRFKNLLLAILKEFKEV